MIKALSAAAIAAALTLGATTAATANCVAGSERCPMPVPFGIWPSDQTIEVQTNHIAYFNFGQPGQLDIWSKGDQKWWPTDSLGNGVFKAWIGGDGHDFGAEYTFRYTPRGSDTHYDIKVMKRR